MEVYHWSRCSTCRTARESLRRRDLLANERDFFAEPLSRAEVERLAGLAGGIRAIFSFNSPSFRKLGRDAAGFLDTELVDLVLGQPRLLKRPLVVDGGRVLTGARSGEEARGESEQLNQSS